MYLARRSPWGLQDEALKCGVGNMNFELELEPFSVPLETAEL